MLCTMDSLNGSIAPPFTPEAGVLPSRLLLLPLPWLGLSLWHHCSSAKLQSRLSSFRHQPPGPILCYFFTLFPTRLFSLTWAKYTSVVAVLFSYWFINVAKNCTNCCPKCCVCICLYVAVDHFCGLTLCLISWFRLSQSGPGISPVVQWVCSTRLVSPLL